MPTTAAYFVLPNGTSFVQLALGGTPATYLEPTAHPCIARLPRLNPAATHLEFARSDLFAAGDPWQVGIRLYVYWRALRQAGPLMADTWAEVPLYAEGDA